MISKQSEVKLMAFDLYMDESMLVHCPFCGAEHERSLSITRKPAGLVYHCFRASCGVSGFVPSNTGYLNEKPKEVKKNAKPYNGSVVYYDHYHYPFLADRFDIDPVYMDEIGIVDEDNHNYLLPVYTTRHHHQVGAQLRRFDGSKPKAILYYDEEGPYVQHLFKLKGLGRRHKSTVFVVEDYFSMLKVQEAIDRQWLNAKAVSILGTHVSDEVAMWLGKHHSKVVMMLDPDAINKAHKFVAKYNLIWPGSSAVLLNEDPKDTDMEVLKELVLLHS
jgi:hypothetical protein